MTPEKTRPNRFGAYLRRQRIESGRSLREVAETVGISHVYLGEVERGVRGPLKPEHWSALVRAIPGLTIEELQSHADASRPLQLDVADAPARYQNLALALARRFERRDLSRVEIAKLLKVLKAGED
ncbi:MAG TPA: helix-turn-helix transcriptional regulator [Candidatus Binataceae bacterium]